MTRLVVDTSVAIKWIIDESLTTEAVNLQNGATLIVPDLLFAECANVLWKKVQRSQLSAKEAAEAAQILQELQVEVTPTRQILSAAVRLSLELTHPAYDCVFLATAMFHDCRLVTADTRFVRRVDQTSMREFVVSLADM